MAPPPGAERRTFVPRPKPKADRMLMTEEELRESFFKGTIDRVADLDKHLFARVIQSGTYDLAGRIQAIDNLEILQNGTETDRSNWTGGVNETTLRTISLGGESIRVIAKAQRGETSFTVRGGAAVRIYRQWNASAGKMETLESPFDAAGVPYTEDAAKAFEYILAEAPKLRSEAAEYYGVEPEEVPLNDQESSTRRGIEAGDLAFREVFAHRMDLMTGLEVVTETVLLPDNAVNPDTGKVTHKNIDLISAQRFVTPEVPGVSKGEIKKKREELFTLMARDAEAYAEAIEDIMNARDGKSTETVDEEYAGWSVRDLNNLLVTIGEEDNSKFEENAIREMTVKEFEELLEQGPKHKYAKSAMRIACLHYLAKALDGHIGNIIVDTTSSKGKLHSADNGLCAGLSKKSDRRNEYGEYEEPADPYRSAMWEAVAKHPDWVVDDEARENFRGLLSRLQEVQQVVDELNASGASEAAIKERLDAEMKSKSGGAEYMYLQEMYSMLYKNGKIATKELSSLMKKLELLVKHGRPPKLPPPKDALLTGNNLMRYEDYLQELRPDEEKEKERFKQAMERFESPDGDDKPL